MDLIKQKVRLELNKFYPLKDDYNNFCNAEDAITDLVINEIENYKKRSCAPEMLEMLIKVNTFINDNKSLNYMAELLNRNTHNLEQLIEKATTI
jgi:hypothetical protein